MTEPRESPLRVVGRYALYDAIASGGMATVHLGRLLGPIGFARTVAIKRLHPHLAADPEFVTMLLDEARVVARIRHPNVVPTLDVVFEQGELFLVMEYVHGESLARLLRVARERGERIPPEMVVSVLVPVLHGLHAAHEARGEQGELLGIVHRDVSPQNILVGADGVPRIVDFGVAKAAGRLGQSTRDGQLKGKLAYMSPEQVHGSSDRRTDIFAASVVLWEALTGTRLFGGETDIEVFSKVMAGASTPPSAHVAGLPRSLDDITLRGLQSNPAKRFSTAREMALALEDALPLVATSKIGAWVEESAEATLGSRAKRVEVIESDSARRTSVPEWTGAASPTLEASGLAPRPPGASETHTTELAAISALGKPAERAAGRRVVSHRVLLVAVLAVAGLIVTVSRSHAPPSPTMAALPSAAAPTTAPTIASSGDAGADASEPPRASASSAAAPVATPPAPGAGRAPSAGSTRPPLAPRPERAPRPALSARRPLAPPAKVPAQEDKYDHM